MGEKTEKSRVKGVIVMALVVVAVLAGILGCDTEKSWSRIDAADRAARQSGGSSRKIEGVVKYARAKKEASASAYIKALLDNSYKNDSTGIVKQKIGTKEEAEALYESGLDAELAQLVEEADMSEELQAEYRAVFANMFKKADYTVGEAEEQEDNSYVVTVSYRQMKIFEPAFASYQKKLNTLSEEWLNMDENEAPTEDEMYETIFTILKDCMKEALQDPEYANEASTSVRVELNSEKKYESDEDELYGLESLLFDIVAIQGLE